jgi:hypothetical protein
MTGNHIPENVDSVAARHVDVQDQQVPSPLPEFVQRLLARRGLVHFTDGLIIHEYLSQASANDCMIINNEYPMHRSRISRYQAAGVAGDLSFMHAGCHGCDFVVISTNHVGL